MQTLRPLGPILPSLGDRVIYDSALPRDARVATIIRDGQWHWPVANSIELLTLKEAIPQSMIPNLSRRDNIRWTPSSTGAFSVKSSWIAIRFHRPQVHWHKLVWYPQNIPRASFILWLAIRQRLGTQDRLPNISNPSCLFCGTQMDNHDHLFLLVQYLGKFGLIYYPNAKLIGSLFHGPTPFTIWPPNGRRIHLQISSGNLLLVLVYTQSRQNTMTDIIPIVGEIPNPLSDKLRTPFVAGSLLSDE